jgi:nucleoside transporter
MNPATYVRLSVMMFIQFFIWGAWYVTVGNYMGKIGLVKEIYWAYTVGPIAAIVSPFFLGMVADRYFATERVLGVLHLLGGIAIFAAPVVAGGESAAGLLFILLLLVHMLCYMPTLGLTNTLAFHNISNSEFWFPLIRVFGTLGWIAAGTVVSKVFQADELPLPLQIAGGAGLLMGLYSFSLPHTPPPAKGKEPSFAEISGIAALTKLGSPSFWVFIFSALLICIPLSAYYAYAPVFVNAVGIANPGFKMSFGQWAEVFFMLAMPFFFRVLGVKWMLFVGMLAWVVRYGLFSAGAEDGVMWMIIGGILLHGICYDFFFVTGQIYVDKKSTPDIRGQAQGFLVLLTLGVGMLIGSIVSGQLFNAIVPAFENPTSEQTAQILSGWRTFWVIPTVGAAVIMVLFALLFKDDSPAAELSEADAARAAAAEEMP